MDKYYLGIDVGSTTAKIILRDNDKILYEKYERHFALVKEKTCELLEEVLKIVGDNKVKIAISGSAGLGISQILHIPFIQEVFATGELVKIKAPDTNCVIELGGEDAKIIFFDGGIDERMNGSCAGGTGAFIDQMATLLNVSVLELDALSLDSTKIYPIASRCGVFAKTDIQPLLNQGAKKQDIAVSIYQAVVNQTIAGLAQGKKINGKVMFLGGPLYYCKGLRKVFKDTLKLTDDTAIFPDYARFAVALGGSYYAEKQQSQFSISELVENLKIQKGGSNLANRLPALFDNENEFQEFLSRHAKSKVDFEKVENYTGNAYLGIDCGSTTTKLVLLSDDNKILYSYYASNEGNPVQIVKEQLIKIYELLGDKIIIKGSSVTGYGEELIKKAFNLDYGLVETIAHYTSAKFFEPEVEFILDIGGQDIKCFKIKNQAIDSIMLNEACSSGCGSFLQTFAKAMGYKINEFAEKGLFSKAPVDLGSRCTVFMNSSVKQSQKDGATVEDISAGLSISVVKNAIYKVIRVASKSELGKKIVVQGGTFYNNAVLRAFERELNINVVRPQIAGLMGAFGCALYAKQCQKSSIIDIHGLQTFTHTSKASVCKGCTNNCHLTINSFGSNNHLISGNQCEKGLGLKDFKQDLPNLYEYKRNYLENLKADVKPTRNYKIGLPLALQTFELLPFWHKLFTDLGFDVVVSKMSNRKTYDKGQFSIPSDTACYPAKIMHGHIAELLEDKVDGIFYPCLSYNLDKKNSDNHYNCPVVAYYSQLLNGNVEDLKTVDFIYPFLNINNQKELIKELIASLNKFNIKISKHEMAGAVTNAFKALSQYEVSIKKEGERAIQYARANDKRILILAGRPYHIDKEICHGIDKLCNTLGFVVVSEDSVYHLTDSKNLKVNVLNQWTYHARLYLSAKLAVENKDMELVQMVSFGCGVDAITTDEVRAILEKGNKLYTQLKIDEISNLGAVKIRLRSLLGALEKRS